MRRWLMAVLVASAAGCVTDDDLPDASPNLPGAPDAESLAWATHAQAPTPRTELAAAALGDKIWTIGGFDSTNQGTRIVEIYDPVMDRWTRGPDYPVPIHHTAAVSDGKTIYVLGGYMTTAFVSTNLAYKLNDARDAWVGLASLPEARGAHAAALVDAKAYLVGGLTNLGAGQTARPVTVVHVYDTATDRWTTGAPIPTAREHLAAAALDGVVYAVGGRMGGFTTNMKKLESYDPASNAWAAHPDMPTARGGLTAAAFRNSVVVVGGEGTGGTFEEVEAFDPGTGNWTALPELPSPRHGLGSSVFGERLYILLGGPNPGFTVSGAVESLGQAS